MQNVMYLPGLLYTSPKTFPGKLTKFLYHRFETFQGDMSKGLVMLPVELIDDNGIMLKKCVMQLIELWGLGDEFKKWVDEDVYKRQLINTGAQVIKRGILSTLFGK